MISDLEYAAHDSRLLVSGPNFNMVLSVYAASPSTAPLLCLRPVLSWSRGLEHHLHLHPVSAPERRGLQRSPTEELPHPGPVSLGPAPEHLLHLPPHCSQVPLHLQPARPLQHIPGNKDTQEASIYTQTSFEKDTLFTIKCQKLP